MICVSLGRMCISTVYGVLYVYTPELYPTAIRTTAVGTCSMSARFGGIASSYIFLWLVNFKLSNMFHICEKSIHFDKLILQAEICPWAVAVALGSMSIIAAFLCLLLPDTNGCGHMATVEDVEQFSQ